MTDDVAAREKARFQAMRDGDVAALEDLMSEALVYVHSSGGRDGKKSYLDQLRAGTLTYPRVTIPDPEVHLSGGGAIVFGHIDADAVRDGTERKLDYDYLSVWAKEDDGAWRMLAQHMR